MLQNTNSVWLCEIYSKLTRRNEWLVVDQKNNVKSPAKKMNIFIRSSEERRRRPDIDERAMMWRASLTGLLYLSAFNPRKRPNKKKKDDGNIPGCYTHTQQEERYTQADRSERYQGATQDCACSCRYCDGAVRTLLGPAADAHIFRRPTQHHHEILFRHKVQSSNNLNLFKLCVIEQIDKVPVYLVNYN